MSVFKKEDYCCACGEMRTLTLAVYLNQNQEEVEKMNQKTKMVFILASIAVALLILIPLIWGGLAGGHMMGPGMMSSFGWGWFMPIFMVLFWVLVIWAVVALLTRATSTRADSSGRIEPALEVLKKRYARGEISKEEYEEKKRDLV